MPATIDPDLALELAKATANAYAQATEELIAIVSRQTAEGTYDPDGWAARKLAESTALRDQARQVVDRLAADTPGLVDTAVRTAYNAGGGFPLGTHTRAVDALVREAVTRLESTYGQILRSLDDAYRDVIARTSTLVTTGSMTVDQARRAALDRFAKQGVTGFTDAAGRRWRLDRYAEMATRTAVGRAQVAGTLDRLVGDGRDLVIVSDHHGACQVCAPFEGKILSITGATTGTVKDGNGDTQRIVGTVASAQAAGLQHPNCRHSLAAFIPGLSIPPEPRDSPSDGVERRRTQNQRDEQARAAERRRAARTGKAAKRGSRHGSVDPSRSINRIPSATSDVGKSVHDAVNALGKVHQVPTTMRQVGITAMRLPRRRRGQYTSGVRQIDIDPRFRNPTLTVAHEYGHHLDFELQPGIQMSSSIANNVVGWRDAVNASRTVQTLRASRALNPDWVDYALDDVELWARSYAQWVALRSGSNAMTAVVTQIQNATGVGRLAQWPDSDFTAIASAFDRIFADRRLLL